MSEAVNSSNSRLEKEVPTWQLSQLPFELEKNLQADPDKFLNPNGFRTAMIRAERCVARIENPDGLPQGTGFLISPDLLITNDHVRANSPGRQRPFDLDPTSVRVRFGYVADSIVTARSYELDAASWLVAESPESKLDFCIVRLSQPAGEHRIGVNAAAPVRGWITPQPCDIVNNQSLSILQHPQGEPLQLAQGHLSKSSNDWIEYHVNTDHGSSGSPVFDCNWRCIAIHSRAGIARNRGIAFRSIIDLLPGDVRDELIPFAAADNCEIESAAGQTLETRVDASVFTILEVQSIAGILLKREFYEANANARVHVKLGRSRKVSLTPSDFASDAMQRLALKGELDVSRVEQAALQEQERNRAIDPLSIMARGLVIQQQTDALLKTIEKIREHVDLLVSEIWTTRTF